MSDLPDKQDGTGNGRDHTGRFLAGHSGNLAGRPPALDLRKIAQDKAVENGIDLEDALWQVVDGLLAKAKGGDAAAAKLLMDRLCGPLESHHLVAGVHMITGMDSGHPKMPMAPEGAALVHWLRKFADLEAEKLGLPMGPPVPETPELARQVIRMAEGSDLGEEIRKQRELREGGT